MLETPQVHYDTPKNIPLFAGSYVVVTTEYSHTKNSLFLNKHTY